MRLVHNWIINKNLIKNLMGLFFLYKMRKKTLLME